MHDDDNENLIEIKTFTLLVHPYEFVVYFIRYRKIISGYFQLFTT